MQIPDPSNLEVAHSLFDHIHGVYEEWAWGAWENGSLLYVFPIILLKKIQLLVCANFTQESYTIICF